MKHPKQVGMSCKNTRFIKASLTPYEARLVQKTTKADRDRWNELMAKPWNKWQPQEETTTAKSSKRSSKPTPPA
jgi:hypothetical protein